MSEYWTGRPTLGDATVLSDKEACLKKIKGKVLHVFFYTY